MQIKCFVFSLIGFGLITYAAYARIGETPEECSFRYGRPIKEKKFDQTVIDHMENTIITKKITYINDRFVPTRVCEYRPEGWVISTLFGRQVLFGNIDKHEWEGERVLSMVFKHVDGSRIEKEVLISIILKLYDGPYGAGFPDSTFQKHCEWKLQDYSNRISSYQSELADLNNKITSIENVFDKSRALSQKMGVEEGITKFKEELKYTQKSYNDARKRKQDEVARYVEWIKRNYDEVIAGTKEIEPANISDVTFDATTVKISISFAEGCVARFEIAKNEIADDESSSAIEAKERLILEKTSDALGTKGF